jgi:methionine synthase II (cobalamin-independent)
LPRGRDLVETTQPRLDFAFLERLPSKRIAIGVLDLEMEKVEKPEVVAARARKALNHVDRTALLARDCGMKYLGARQRARSSRRSCRRPARHRVRRWSSHHSASLSAQNFFTRK